jgi:hypothetical protein
MKRSFRSGRRNADKKSKGKKNKKVLEDQRAGKFSRKG